MEGRIMEADLNDSGTPAPPQICESSSSLKES